MIPMTAFQLKLIALITMVIDHVGVFFFPQILLFRIIGRLAMPLFAWLIANGAHHTKDIYSYMRRILVFAVISEVPFVLANRQRDPAFDTINILFSFTLGLGAIMLLNKTRHTFMRLAIILASVAAAYMLKTDYGPTAVLMVVISYVYYKDLPKMIMLHTLLIVSVYTLPILIQLSGNPHQAVDGVRLFQPLCLLSLLAIAFYNKKEGIKTGYYLYFFYPLHLLIIYLLKLL